VTGLGLILCSPCDHVCPTVESREAVLAAVKVRGQARLVHLVSTISGASRSSTPFCCGAQRRPEHRTA
jgi:hypothetical protein